MRRVRVHRSSRATTVGTGARARWDEEGERARAFEGVVREACATWGDEDAFEDGRAASRRQRGEGQRFKRIRKDSKDSKTRKTRTRTRTRRRRADEDEDEVGEDASTRGERRGSGDGLRRAPTS